MIGQNRQQVESCFFDQLQTTRTDSIMQFFLKFNLRFLVTKT